MNRKEFLAGSVLAGAFAAFPRPLAAAAPTLSPAGGVRLRLCLPWHEIPADDMNAKLDFLEANGYEAVEIPTGDWLFTEGGKLKTALRGRKLAVATACGPSDFSSADQAKREAEVAKFLPQLEVLGDLKSTGLILCPARGKVGMPFDELRKDFVGNTGKRLADKAAACGTAIVLEPLRRGETPFLRQVADAAKMAQEMGPGARCMADFWHMKFEETDQFAAMVAGGRYLAHVHIASLKDRKIPGYGGAEDDYRAGFRGLKFIGYRGVVSLEGGWPAAGKDASGKPLAPPRAEQKRLLADMCTLLRRQWDEAAL